MPTLQSTFFISPAVTCWRVLLQIAAPSVGLPGNTAGRTMLISVWTATKPRFTSTGKRSDLSWKEKWNLWAPSFSFFLFFWFLSVKFLASSDHFHAFILLKLAAVLGFYYFFFPFWCLELWISTAATLAGNPVFAGLAHRLAGKKVHFHQQIKQGFQSKLPKCPVLLTISEKQKRVTGLQSPALWLVIFNSKFRGVHNSLPSLKSKYKKLVIWKYFLNRVILKHYLTFAWRDFAPYYLVLTFNNICILIELPLLYTAIIGISWAGHVKRAVSILTLLLLEIWKVYLTL